MIASGIQACAVARREIKRANLIKFAPAAIR